MECILKYVIPMLFGVLGAGLMAVIPFPFGGVIFASMMLALGLAKNGVLGVILGFVLGILGGVVVLGLADIYLGYGFIGVGIAMLALMGLPFAFMIVVMLPYIVICDAVSGIRMRFGWTCNK